MPEPLLQVTNLHKSFGGLKVSDNISLELMPGEIHALIGPNGAGKSTLIKQIAGDLSPDEGSIQLMGHDVTSLNPEQRVLKGLAQTFQISALVMDYTVLQNAVLGALGASQKHLRFFRPAMKDTELLDTAYEALKKVELQDMAHTLTANLSHGQRRQLEIAVALTLRPKVFLMDEPMAGMGEAGSKHLVGVLDELRHNAPILLVEHDMDAVFSLADRISVLVYGRVIKSGTVKEIQNDPEVRQAYLGDED